MLDVGVAAETIQHESVMVCGGRCNDGRHFKKREVVLSASSFDRYSRPSWEAPLERYHRTHSRPSDAPTFRVL